MCNHGLRCINQKYFLYCFHIVICQALATSKAFADKPFIVKKLKGDVQYQRPLTAEWQNIKLGQKVPDGAILQIQKSSSISLSYAGSLNNSETPVKESTVNINKPMIIRLTPTSFRKIEMDSKLISGQPDLQTLEMMKKNTKFFDNLMDAWKQDATTLSGKDWLNDDMLKLLNEAMKEKIKDDPVSVTAKIGKIKLFQPKDNQVTWARDLPAELNMNWQIDDADQKIPEKFNIYIWKEGEARQVFAQVKGMNFNAKLASEGKYYVQVESLDKSYKSELRTIRVDRKRLRPGTTADEEIASKDGNDSSLRAAISKRIRLESPLSETYWYSAKSWPTLEFKWQRPDICVNGTLFEFNVTDIAGRSLFKEKTINENILWQPNIKIEGSLRWHVETIACRDDAGKVRKEISKSNARTIYLIKAQNLTEVQKKLAKTPKRGTFVLDLNTL